MNLKTEKNYWHQGYQIIIGVDEAGRGPLAGPVTAASVIINSKIESPKSKLKNESKNFNEILKLTKDSKKLSTKQREKIFALIKKVPEIKYAYASVNEKIIDEINIEQATFLAMKKSINKLIKKAKVKPDLILIDGNKQIPHLQFNQKTIIKGDDKIFSIALASIIAKVIRDRLMINLSKKYPQYHFEIHKGYPTKLHLELLKKYGPSLIHRKSFEPVRILIRNKKSPISKIR